MITCRELAELLLDYVSGDLLGLGLAAVKSRLHRARLRMRAALAPHFEELSA